MNFREILFIGCVVLVLTVCVLGFVGSFFRSPQPYDVVRLSTLKPSGIPGISPEGGDDGDLIRLERRTARQEYSDEATAPRKASVPAPKAAVPAPRAAAQPAAPAPVAAPVPAVAAAPAAAAPAPSAPVPAVRMPEAQKTSDSDQTLMLYTVKKGDSLSVVARTFNLKADRILKDNRLTADEAMQLGRRILIFVSPGRLPANRREAGREYRVCHTVAQGETASSIAAAYHVSLKDIVEANRGRVRDVNLVVPDQELLIPLRD